MKYPKINFKVDKEMDKENIKFFLNYKSRSGHDSFLELVKFNPELKGLREKSKEEQEKVINEFIDRTYNKLEESLEKDKKEVVEPAWDDIAEEFFEASSKIFDGHKFSRSEYTAYLTIFWRFRYNLEKSYFYIPPNFKKTSLTLLTMHELLHFLFFDYWEKNFSGRLDKDKLWDLSEILNVLILLDEPFVTLGGAKSIPYPAHERKFAELKPIWNKRKSMKDFIDKAVERM